MPPLIPARCRDCGRTWQPRAIHVENSTDITIEGQTTRCECGGLADVMNGTFDVVGGAINLTSGPQWSFDLLDAVGLALRTAAMTGADPASVVEHISPETARSLRAALFGKPQAVKTGVASALAVLFADFDVAKDNLLSVVRAAEELLRFVAENGHLPGS